MEKKVGFIIVGERIMWKLDDFIVLVIWKLKYLDRNIKWVFFFYFLEVICIKLI